VRAIFAALLGLAACAGPDEPDDQNIEAVDLIDEDGVSECLEPDRWMDCVELCSDAGMECDASWAYPNSECAVSGIPSDWDGPKRESCDADGAGSFQCQCSG
jgi:hypothetical protein